MPQSHHSPSVRLDPRQPPPAGYYAANLLTVVEAVLLRYRDVLTEDEQRFGEGIRALTSPAQRLLARLIGRVAARDNGAVREDRLHYAEVC